MSDLSQLLKGNFRPMIEEVTGFFKDPLSTAGKWAGDAVEGLGGAISGTVKNKAGQYVGGQIDKATGMDAASQAKDYFNQVFPGTNPWERLGSSQQASGIPTNTARIQANAQVKAAKIAAQANMYSADRAFGEQSPNMQNAITNADALYNDLLRLANDVNRLGVDEFIQRFNSLTQRMASARTMGFPVGLLRLDPMGASLPALLKDRGKVRQMLMERAAQLKQRSSQLQGARNKAAAGAVPIP